MVAIVGISILTVSFVKHYVETQTIQSLSQQLTYIDHILKYANHPESLDDVLNDIHTFEGYDVRLTMIAKNGTVFFDSAHNIEFLDNHQDRPEFISAKKNMVGSAIRYSKTLKKTLVYVAKVNQNGGVHRLALPINYLQDELLGNYQFDYLIGAGHYTPYNGEWLSSFKELNCKPHLKSYTEHLCQMMESKMFAFIAHPDIFGCSNLEWSADLTDCSRAILKTAEDTKTPLEINGNGLRKKYLNCSTGLRPPYPWRPFWELATEYNIKVVCNSDCHYPNEVVAGISENLELANSLGLELADLSHL